MRVHAPRFWSMNMNNATKTLNATRLARGQGWQVFAAPHIHCMPGVQQGEQGVPWCPATPTSRS